MKKGFSLLIAVAAVFGFMLLAPKAQAADSRCVCCGNASGAANHTCKSVAFQDWTSAVSLPTLTGNYALTKDVTLATAGNVAQITAAGTKIHIDLQGKTVNVPSGRAWSVNNSSVTNVTITIGDSVGGGKIVTTQQDSTRQGGIIWSCAANTTLTLYGGTLDASGYRGSGNGAAVCIEGSGSSFTMYGGAIAGGETTGNGGAVYIPSGCTYTMYGGTVSGGRARMGGNLYCAGTAAVSGGTFSDGSGRHGGNLYLTGSAVLSDCTFTGGTATSDSDVGNGGNINAEGKGRFTMTNVTLSGGKAVRGGNLSVFTSGNTMENCTVSGGDGLKGAGNVFLYNGGGLTMQNCSVGACTGTGNIYALGAAGETSLVVDGGSIVDDSDDAPAGIDTSNASVTLKGDLTVTTGKTDVYIRNADDCNGYYTITDLSGLTTADSLTVDAIRMGAVALCGDTTFAAPAGKLVIVRSGRLHLGVSDTVTLMDANGKVKDYTTLEEAVEDAGENQYIRVNNSVYTYFTADKDIYLDVWNRKVYGEITVTSGHSLYGMDSTTDTYDKTGGYICAQIHGTVQNMYRTAGGKSYLTTVEEKTYEAGNLTYRRYYFDRFYAGAVATRLTPRDFTLGCKFAFAGNAHILAQLEGYGFSVAASGGSTAMPTKTYRMTQGFRTGINYVCLQIRGLMDTQSPESYTLIGSTYITLAGNTYSANYETDPQTVLQTIDADYLNLTRLQRRALLGMYRSYADKLSALCDTIKTAAVSQCACGGRAEGVGSHTCAKRTFKPWDSATALPTTSGNYYLTKDITCVAALINTTGTNIALDLNGHTVTTTSRSYYINSTSVKNVSLSLTDSVGGGVIKTVQTDSTRQGGVLWISGTDCVLSIYGGTYDASDYQGSGAGTVLALQGTNNTCNFYGGTLISGTTTAANKVTYTTSANHLYQEGGQITRSDQSGTFRVGFGRVDITPTYSVPMAGYGDADTRWSTGVYDNLYASCIAVTDESDTTALIYTVDMGNITESAVNTMRQAISEATGVDSACIIINCSHTHSGVEYRSTGYKVIRQYLEELQTWLAEAGTMAMADRNTATMLSGSVDTENMNFVRRYVMDDGSFAGDNYGDHSLTFTAHESEADAQMQVVKFLREGCNDIYLCNWQAHAHVSYPDKSLYYLLSPDYVGTFRREMEDKTDAFCAFMQGAAGNLNGRSEITSEKANYEFDQTLFGEKLASYAMSATLTQAAAGTVTETTYMLEAACNHTQDSMYTAAKAARDYYNANGNDATFQAMLAEGNFNSIHHINGIIANYSLPETDEIELKVVSIGDVAFACFPYEMFCQEGVYIKTNSAFKTTMISGYTNGYFAYIPDDLGWQNGGYERDITKFVQGTAEACAHKLVDMLNQIHQ